MLREKKNGEFYVSEDNVDFVLNAYFPTVWGGKR